LNIGVFPQFYVTGLFTTDRALNHPSFSTGAHPGRVTRGTALYRIYTIMFLHGGWEKCILAGNYAVSLIIFGDNIEDEMGHGSYLLFYLACGLLSATGPCNLAPNFASSRRLAPLGRSQGVMGGLPSCCTPKPKSTSDYLICGFFRIFRSPHGSNAGLVAGDCSYTRRRGSTHVAAWPIGPSLAGFIVGIGSFTIPPLLRLGGAKFWSTTDGHRRIASDVVPQCQPHPKGRRK